MQFIPYDDELKIINEIHKFNPNDYTIIRLTETMLLKGIIDANVFFRDLLLKNNVLDFSKLNNKVCLTGSLILNSQKYEVKMSLYKATTRGDERFWIYGLNEYVKSSLINTGDLLYITVNKNDNNSITLFNLTNSRPDIKLIKKIFGSDKINNSLNKLIPKIRELAKKGYHNNSKGSGEISPKDAGDTLEYLLGIKSNNRKTADFEETIELKTKTSNSLDTLFTLRPNFEGTQIALIEPDDKSRVSAFTRLYGYESTKHKQQKSLYITISTKENSQNNQGFYLKVNDEKKIIELRKNDEDNRNILTAFWDFNSLEKELHIKHPATLWITAKSIMNGDTAQFKYEEAELTRSPQFLTFISLIKSGSITYDWRGYTTPSGKYSGKNHGNAWRIKSKYRTLLFGSIEKIKL